MGVTDKPAYAFVFCCPSNTENNEGVSKAVLMRYLITADVGF